MTTDQSIISVAETPAKIATISLDELNNNKKKSLSANIMMTTSGKKQLIF